MKKDYFFYRVKAFLLCLIFLGALTLLLLGIQIISCDKKRPEFLLCAGLWIALLLAGFHFVYIPYKKIKKVCVLFTEGYRTDPFLSQDIRLSPVADKVTELLSRELDTTKRLNVAKEQAQYLALQNQINPHFLYNTLEGIRGEAVAKGMDNIAEMTEALATFFRYTISNLDHLVTVEDELANIESYYTIQQFRFGERLSLRIEYEQEEGDRILNLKIPKLILQPIVENSIYHGIERKYGKGTLVIHFDITAKYMMIRISDDGVGIEKNKLKSLNERLMSICTESMEERSGGIAIVNVNNRIKLLFGEEYGVVIYSTPGLGTDVEITLPVVED